MSAKTGARVENVVNYLGTELEKGAMLFEHFYHHQMDPWSHIHEVSKKPNGGRKKCWSSSSRSTYDQSNNIALHEINGSSAAVYSIDPKRENTLTLSNFMRIYVNVVQL